VPLEITNTAGNTAYANPLLGPINHVDHVKLDVSAMTTAEVDANGYLKPGVPLTQGGILVGVGAAVYGITFEPIKLPGRTNNANLGTDTSDPLIAVVTHGLVNRDIGEDNLGRAYNANEIAGFAAAGSTLKLTST
jgi:hypothetical protein